MDMDSKIMGKIGFNCQLHLNRAGFVLHEEDFVQHVLFDTGRRRTRLGILKKIEEAKPSQDDTDQPPLLAPNILPFPKELELHLFSISIQEFLCVFMPL